MTADPSPPNPNQIVGIFAGPEALVAAVDALLANGFDRADVSVLADHDVLRRHFGEDLPDAASLADMADAPRRAVSADATLRAAAHIVAEGIATLGLIGAAGVTYAIGGPIGLASVAGDKTETSLEGVLDGTIDSALAAHYRDHVVAGGVVCWVACPTEDRATTATDLLRTAGARDVHKAPA